MGFKIYLASSWHNRENARLAMKQLEAAGHEITHDWTTTLTGKNEKELEQQAVEDVEGVGESQVYVMLWPGRLGSATELGMALVWRKRVFIVGINQFEQLDYVFANHPRVHIFPTMEALIRHLGILIKRQQSFGDILAEAAMAEEDSMLGEDVRELYDI